MLEGKPWDFWNEMHGSDSFHEERPSARPNDHLIHSFILVIARLVR